MLKKSALPVICLCFFLFSASFAFADKPILIGAPLPLTGPYASDGEQMKMALQMAAEEYNANGGILGRKVKIVFGDVGGLEAEKIKAVGERLIASGVHAVITGYDDGGVDTKVFGQYDIPYLHCNAMTLCTEPVAKEPDKYWNCFQYTYNDKVFGIDTINNLFDVPEKIDWAPPNKKIAIIKVDYAFNITPADDFAQRAGKLGYEIVVDEITQFGVVEWGAILSKIESSQPSYVTFWNLDPTDAARFIKQFVDRFSSDGINALVWMQYTPSVPEFIELAGNAADGLIYSVGAKKTGAKTDAYRKRWVDKFKQEPAGMYAAATRDGFDIWAQAVKRAGCVDCYPEIARLIRESIYLGLVANYAFNPIDQSALYGEYLVPIIWNQIWDGKSFTMGPGHYKKSAYRKPPWFKQ